MAQEATLQHPSVNGGTAVKLNLAHWTFSWKNLVRTNPIDAKYDIAEVDYTGFENPRIVIRGVIDADTADTDVITQTLLVDFVTLRSETPLTLTITFGGVEGGETEDTLGGRPTGGYDTTGSNTLSTTIKVWIEAFDMDSGTDKTKEGQRVDFGITFVEST